MAEASGGQSFETRVVLNVRRGDDDRRGTCELEYGALERRKSRRFEMLDDFDCTSSVVTRHARVAVCQCALEQFDALALLRRQTLEFQSVHGNVERAQRYVHTY